MQHLVRLCADYRIKPHAPPLVLVTVNSFEFQPCGHTSQAENLMRLLKHQDSKKHKNIIIIIL